MILLAPCRRCKVACVGKSGARTGDDGDGKGRRWPGAVHSKSESLRTRSRASSEPSREVVATDLWRSPLALRPYACTKQLLLLQPPGRPGLLLQPLRCDTSSERRTLEVLTGRSHLIRSSVGQQPLLKRDGLVAQMRFKLLRLICYTNHGRSRRGWRTLNEASVLEAALEATSDESGRDSV